MGQLWKPLEVSAKLLGLFVKISRVVGTCGTVQG